MDSLKTIDLNNSSNYILLNEQGVLGEKQKPGGYFSKLWNWLTSSSTDLNHIILNINFEQLAVEAKSGGTDREKLTLSNNIRLLKEKVERHNERWIVKLAKLLTCSRSEVATAQNNLTTALKLMQGTGKRFFPQELTDVDEFNGGIGGTTGAQVAQIGSHAQWITKKGSPQGGRGHLLAEYAANKVYKVMGAPVPEVVLYHETQGRRLKKDESATENDPVMLSQFIVGRPLYAYLADRNVSIEDKEAIKQTLQKHFVLDCLLGNYDVMGTANDNVLVTGDGIPCRIDNGSSFEYRAQGGLKDNVRWSNVIQELTTMRVETEIAKNALFLRNAINIFGSISDEEIVRQIDEIVEKREDLIRHTPEKYREVFNGRIDHLIAKKQELLEQKAQYLKAQKAELSDKDKTVVFDKNFASDGLVVSGIPFAAKEEPDWASIPDKEIDEPLMPQPTMPGMAVSAGVVVREPDGRVWLVEPKGHFGGYEHTFPKGRQEDSLSLQQTALKEAFEESGLQVEIEGYLLDQERTTTITRYYVAKRVGGDPTQAGWESDRVKLATIEDAQTTLLNNQNDLEILNEIVERSL